MNNELINFGWIVNNIIVHSLLINYLILIKEWIHKQLVIGVLLALLKKAIKKIRSSRKQKFLKVGVLKNLQHSEENACVGVSF